MLQRYSGCGIMRHMGPQELRAWIDANGYTVSGLARDLDVDRSTVHRWLNGSVTVPRSIDLALEALTKK